MTEPNPAAVLGQKGGSKNTPAQQAARLNNLKNSKGRPKKPPAWRCEICGGDMTYKQTGKAFCTC